MAESRATATLQVTIQESCITDTKRSHAVKIELDSELNGEATCFTPNTDIYLRVFPTPEDLDYSMAITLGTIERYPEGDGLLKRQEYVSITNGEGSTNYPIHEILSKEWIGVEPCGIDQVQYGIGFSYLACAECVGSPDCGNVCETTWGVIRITYYSLFHSWVASVPEVAESVISAFENLTGDCLTS